MCNVIDTEMTMQIVEPNAHNQMLNYRGCISKEQETQVGHAGDCQSLSTSLAVAVSPQKSHMFTYRVYV